MAAQCARIRVMMHGVEEFHHEITSKGYRCMRVRRAAAWCGRFSFAPTFSVYGKASGGEMSRSWNLGVLCGTDGSNSVPSSRGSANFQFDNDRNPRIARPS
jgi:hypothetical protein